MAALEQHRRAVEARKKRIPLRYWTFWWSLMVVADLVFYVLLTPIWMGLRAIAWLTEMWSRLRRGLRHS